MTDEQIINFLVYGLGLPRYGMDDLEGKVKKVREFMKKIIPEEMKIKELEKLLIELWQTQKLFATKENKIILHPEAIEKLEKLGEIK